MRWSVSSTATCNRSTRRRVKRQFAGLAETVRDARLEIPDGMLLVKVDDAQFRWHPRKPSYVLRLSVLEPLDLAGSPSWVGSTAQPKRCGSWAGSSGIFSTNRSCWLAGRLMRRRWLDSVG
jgi:hypothetical protein